MGLPIPSYMCVRRIDLTKYKCVDACLLRRIEATRHDGGLASWMTLVIPRTGKFLHYYADRHGNVAFDMYDYLTEGDRAYNNENRRETVVPLLLLHWGDFGPLR